MAGVTSQVRPAGIIVFVAGALGLILNAWLPHLIGVAEASPEWRQAAAGFADKYRAVGALFQALPPWVKLWMGFQHMVFASSLLFVLWRREAQLYLLGILLSHLASYTEIALLPPRYLSLGLVSLNHLLWAPALALLLARMRGWAGEGPYGLWCGVAVFQLVFSLTFDVRDSALYLWRLLV